MRFLRASDGYAHRFNYGMHILEGKRRLFVSVACGKNFEFIVFCHKEVLCKLVFYGFHETREGIGRLLRPAQLLHHAHCSGLVHAIRLHKAHAHRLRRHLRKEAASVHSTTDQITK